MIKKIISFLGSAVLVILGTSLIIFSIIFDGISRYNTYSSSLSLFMNIFLGIGMFIGGVFIDGLGVYILCQLLDPINPKEKNNE